MLKVLLSISMILGISYNEEQFEITKIEYNSNNTSEYEFYLNIELFSPISDIVKMNIYFCEDEVCNINYFSSVLNVNGYQKTIAKIPYTIYEKLNLKIIFMNNNGKTPIEKIDFPVYQKEKNICNLTKYKSCKSKNPSIIIYEDGKLTQQHSRLVLSSDENVFYSFNNKIPLNQINISGNLINDQGYANMYIENKIDEFDIYYNQKYDFPLNVVMAKNSISFEFSNMYYLDLINGKVSENYNVDSVYLKDIVFPYRDGEYKIFIELDNLFYDFSKVILDFSVIVKGQLLGDCSNSKYCLRRKY